MTIVSIPANDRIERFEASAGQTVFSYDFPIYAAEHLAVSRWRAGVRTNLAQGADYNVSGAGTQPGGTITLTTPALLGDQIVIKSAQPDARTTEFDDGGDLPAASINSELNRIFISLQQQAETIAGTMRRPDNDSANMVLPEKSVRAGRWLSFDANGAPLLVLPTGDAVSPLAGWLDVIAAGYIKADGVTDDTAGWRNAAATGRPLYYPGGNTIVTDTITSTATGQMIMGHPERSIVTGVGNFDTFVFGGGALFQGLFGIRFNSIGKTGGYDYSLGNCFRFDLDKVFHFDPWQAGYIGGFGNAHQFRYTTATGVRGPRAWLVYGTNAARAGGFDAFMMRAGVNDGIGLEIDGNVSGVSLWGYYANGAPAGASGMTHGVKIHNSAGAASGPRIIYGHNVQVEFSKEEGVRVDEVDDLKLVSFYSAAGIREGLYLGAGAVVVSVVDPKINRNGRHGIYTDARNLQVTGGYISGNSIAGAFADNRGDFDGVHCGAASQDTTIVGTRIGNVGGLEQRFGVYGAAGAARITVVGCDLQNNLIAAARDDTTAGLGNMQVIGCIGFNASFPGGLMIGSQSGTRAWATPIISGGAITGAVMLDQGLHFEVAPSVFAFDRGGGTGFTGTANLSNGKITGITPTNGGAGYTAATKLYFRPAPGAAGLRALNTAVADYGQIVKAQGAAAVTLGNELGNGATITNAEVNCLAPMRLPTFTVAGLPLASSYARAVVYVSNESGGAVLAFSDGTNWRRVTDRNVVS